MRPSSLYTLECQKRSLIRAGFQDPDSLEAQDYPKVQEVLGWSPGTYRTFLGYMKKNGDNLPCSFRIPNTVSQEDIKTLEAAVSPALMATLIFTGCRWSELWNMSMPQPDALVIHTKKGGSAVYQDLGGFSDNVRERISDWVNHESKQLTPAAARSRWNRSGVACVPHDFRHRFATTLSEHGMEMSDISNLLGHRSLRTTKRYMKKQTARAIEGALAYDD